MRPVCAANKAAVLEGAVTSNDRTGGGITVASCGRCRIVVGTDATEITIEAERAECVGFLAAT